MAETMKKPTSNRSAKERRNTLFRVLDGVLSLSHEKIHNSGNSDRVLEKSLIVFDEFTSVVDREIAKVSAFAISNAVRRSNKKFIAVTCHYDVVDWLQPDWVFCTDTMEFSRKKEVGRPLNSKSIGAAQIFGKCFGLITI